MSGGERPPSAPSLAQVAAYFLPLGALGFGGPVALASAMRRGAAAATLGIFSPAVLFTVTATPLLLRHGSNRRLQGFVRGVTVSVVGVLAGTTVLVARPPSATR